MKNTKLAGQIVKFGMIAGLGLVMLGCDGDDGGSGQAAIGTTTIEGNIDNFSGIRFSLAEPPSSFGEKIASFWDALPDLLVTTAYADSNTGGVLVRLDGTDLSTVTDDRGHFVMSGVPEGQQRLRFAYQEHTSSLGLFCPSNSYIRLNGMNLQNGSHMDLNMSQEFMQRGGRGTWEDINFSPGGGHVGQSTHMELNSSGHMGGDAH